MTTPAGQTADPASVAALAALEPPAIAAIGTERSEQQALEKLLSQELYADAVRFLACLLPRREAVWWAWISVRKCAAANEPPQQKACLDAVERWLAAPTDENRRGAFAAAEAAEFSTPVGCVGLAVFLSGESLAPAGLQAVPPGEHLAGKAVANAMLMAAVGQQPEKAPERLRAFLEQGKQLAERIQLWRKRQG